MPRSRCVHHWIVAPANGPTSMGQCRECGRRKRFKNSVEDYGSDHWNSPLFAVTPGREKYGDSGDRLAYAEQMIG